MIIAIVIIVALVAATYIYLRQPVFGKPATAHRLTQMQASAHYKNGQFLNQSYTPQLAEGVSMPKIMRDFIFNKNERSKPAGIMPSVQTNLKQIPADENVLVWFGHSSYFIQVDGKKILVDPVFSGHASPVSFSTKSFNGSNTYGVADMPDIDYLIISHDHYDHMDYETVLQLKDKVRLVITGLGVGAHLERWGYDPKIIIEKDWNQEIKLDNDFVVYTTPARHFSGRSLKRNNTVWSSFVLSAPSIKIFIGGDSGYDTHFAEIGSKYGPFDLAILENGQYNLAWKYIHMLPEQVVQAAQDLKAKVLLPVHWAKFSLSLHAWDEPINRVTTEAELKHQPLIHPMIGEVVQLNNLKAGNKWWKEVK
ncbi:MAG: MBL fold metallo-hydrolase [Sphingobacteriales bacterium]|nr:MAG: MBL fold metallo-hydrolase [Sphingobacteriales bacterium]